MLAKKKKPEIDDGSNSTFKISVNPPFTSSSKEPQKKKIEVSEEVHESIKVNSVKELKEMIIKSYERDNSMLSLTLSGTGDWEEKEEVLYIYANNSFDVSMLKNNIRLISDYVKLHFVRNLKIEVLKESYRVKQDENSKFENAKVDKEVKTCKLLDIVIEMFEGELVSATPL